MKGKCCLCGKAMEMRPGEEKAELCHGECAYERCAHHHEKEEGSMMFSEQFKVFEKHAIGMEDPQPGARRYIEGRCVASFDSLAEAEAECDRRVAKCGEGDFDWHEIECPDWWHAERAEERAEEARRADDPSDPAYIPF